jgi:hypothetical protein
MTDQNPASAVVASVDQYLDLATTWRAWDGRPIARIIDDLPSTWAPHKAIGPGSGGWPGAICFATT